MNRPPFPKHRHLVTMGALAFLSLLAAAPSQAQIVVQPYPAQQAFPQPYMGYPQAGYPGQLFPGPQPGFMQPVAPQYPQNMGGSYPEGVDQAYGLEGDNSLLIAATPEGYWRAREFIKGIDEDLDIIRTKIALVTLTSDALKPLGLMAGGATALSKEDVATLVTAYKKEQIKPTDSVDIITRENTGVDTSLQREKVTTIRDKRSGMPLTIVPRVNRDGTLAVEVIEPVSATRSAKSGDTTVLLIPSQAAADSVSLLFLTPTLMPSNYRPGR